MKWMITLLSLMILSVSCASKKYVSQEMQASETRTQQQIEELKGMVEATQTEIRDLAEELDVKIEDLSSETAEAAGKAVENAEAIAKMGHISFKKTLSEAGAFFQSDSADLNDAARAELDKFATLLKRQNRMVHIEIQGHTDNRGSDAYNRMLGEKRASEVRDYLYREHDIPLHLMNVISMGADDPAVENDTRENRAKNRRVVMVVRVKV